MTDMEFKQALIKHGDVKRTANLPAACRLLWPEPMSWDAKNMEYTATFDTTEDMGNPVGWLHGGVMATILDNGMGTLASIFSGGCMVPTVSLSINYLRPAPLVGKVIMKASILRLGQSLIHTSAQLYWETTENKPFASATAVYGILRDVKV